MASYPNSSSKLELHQQPSRLRPNQTLDPGWRMNPRLKVLELKSYYITSLISLILHHGAAVSRPECWDRHFPASSLSIYTLKQAFERMRWTLWLRWYVLSQLLPPAVRWHLVGSHGHVSEGVCVKAREQRQKESGQ